MFLSHHLIKIYAYQINRAPLCPPALARGIIKNNTNAFQLVITDKDVLFQYIYPFFRDLSFYNRKGIDFSIWSLVLYIFINGYPNLPKGREILLKLSKNMNSKRYFSDLSYFIKVDELENLLKIEPSF